MSWITCVVCLCSSVCLAGEPRQSAAPQPRPLSTSPAPPVFGRERVDWFLDSTVGARSLLAGVFSAGWSTALDEPPEYGPHWEGFAKRYGMRLTGVSVGNAIEAGLGAVWDEDPRYPRAASGSVIGRIGHAAKLTVMARRGDGLAPAYARYAAIAGNNFLSNSWRVPSDDSTTDAIARTAVGFSGRFVSNLFDEFWPSLRRRFFRPQP